MPHAPKHALAACVLAVASLAAPSAARATTQAAGGFVVGTSGHYDYSPTVIQQGSVQDFYWCGDSTRTTDTIFREQYSLSPSVHVTIPQTPVLAEGPAGSWDSLYTCNPDVIRGSFVNPLGNGLTYTWAMYYVGTAVPPGVDNAVGAAFSTDGSTWVKAPQPVITPPNPGRGFYGVGQPNVSYVNGTLTMLYERFETGFTHWMATSADGVHWTTAGQLSTTGLPSPEPQWGGAAYDPADGRWYATYHEPLRPPGTTGGVAERGQPGVTLYATSDPLNGAWTELDTVDTVTTGYEANFIPALLRQADGTLYGPGLPSVTLYLSTSNPRPPYNAWGAQLGNAGGFNTWDVAWSIWAPGSPLRALQRVDHSGGWHEITTGWWDTSFYHLEAINLGHLYEAPSADGATLALYACKSAALDYTTSTDPGCAGGYRLGLDGYAYPNPGPGRIALYKCTVPTTGDFVSSRADCEGQQVDGLLGYAAN